MTKSQKKLFDAMQVELGGYCVDCREDAREQPEDDYYRGRAHTAEAIYDLLDKEQLEATMRELNKYKWQTRWLFISAWLFRPIKTFKAVHWLKKHDKKKICIK